MATDKERVLAWASREGEFPLPSGLDATGTAIEPDCGDHLTMGFKTHREVITEIGFDLTKSACPPTRASAVCAAHLAKGKAVMAAYLTVTAKTIAKELSADGELDEGHVHCALMAELAFKRALAAYSARKRAEHEAQ